MTDNKARCAYCEEPVSSNRQSCPSCGINFDSDEYREELEKREGNDE